MDSEIVGRFPTPNCGGVSITLAIKVLILLVSLGELSGCTGGMAHVATSEDQANPFKHIIVIFQENRTPDNLFQGLCQPPFGTSSTCTTSPSAGQYNIATRDWLDKHSRTGTTQPTAVPLGVPYDLGHTHSDFLKMYDGGKMDGASDIPCFGHCPAQPQFAFVEFSSGVLSPYLELATQYGWANYMFQTNQGPSFPAHQFIFGGTSAPSAADDVAGIFAAENLSGGNIAGCIALAGTTVALVTPSGENQSIYPCFEHQTLSDLLNQGGISWKYYAPGASTDPHGSIWTAPNAIQHICEPTQAIGGDCAGPDWMNNVDLKPSDVLTDIMNCNLRGLSWVIPIGQNSDHAGGLHSTGGPSWVASIVDAIGLDTKCEAGNGYWSDTAIVITWDDWGGWYDHEPPTILGGNQGDYQYGFRVPLIVVSAFTQKGYVDNGRQDFGSILRFIEGTFQLPGGKGALGFSDARSTDDLSGFFKFGQLPRPFMKITAAFTADYFIKDSRSPEPPDND
ncbi:MAG: hypothetical protein JO249_10950 [Acidobacteria bacterium]|nr:hypothetical protein [Acidobacteriota bacterium]